MKQQKFKHKIIESYLQTNFPLNKSKHQLADDEKKSLARGLKDFEEGRVLSDEAIRKPYAKYFK